MPETDKRVSRVQRPSLWLAALGLTLSLAAAFSAPAQAQNLTFGEYKFGVLAHDAHFLGGKEHGVDLNPEVILPSWIDDAWAAGVPWYLRWTVQPRFTVGGEGNTSGFTSQVYFGATWTWQLASNLIRRDDGLTFGIFFGPSFNNGRISSSAPDRKSLGSNILFREAFEIGYRITPDIQISAILDHVSNGGLAKQNQSINDVGGRIGFRF